MTNATHAATHRPETASLILELHHRRIDEMLDGVEIAIEIGSWGEARSLFARFRGELEEHIRIEEQLMFPSFEAFMRTMAGATAVMRAEHGQIAGCLDAVEESLDVETLDVDALDELEALLASHNVKEERVLYPAFERHAPPEAYRALLGDLRPLVDR